MKTRGRRIASWLRISEKETAAEKGAVLILIAASLTVLLGMAALSVDYGWLYYNQLNTRKAAEAAALAGVVHMPLPDCAPPEADTDPYKSAIDVAGRNGYTLASGATVTPLPGGTCARLRVDITRPIDTFFLRVFGYDTLKVTESATAEQLPPLKLGSDEPYLGEDPTDAGRNRNFFLAISGADRAKGQGDAVAAQRKNNGNANPEYKVPSYYYAFEIPEKSPLIGTNVQVQIYDPQAHDEGGQGNLGENGKTNDWVYPRSGSIDLDGWDSRTVFRVYKPDASPNYWLDNKELVTDSVSGVPCEKTYRGHSAASGKSNAAYEVDDADTWVNVCTIGGAGVGIYVIEVSSDPGSTPSGTEVGTDMINGFSIRGAVSDSAVMSSAALRVYGLGAMSLWQFDTGSNPVFKIARVDEVYAGSRLIISLWDVSDIGSTASIEFVGAAKGFDPVGSNPGSPPIDCKIRIQNDSAKVLQNKDLTGNWVADSGGDTCYLTFNDGDYNNRWVQFELQIPADYKCIGHGDGSSATSPGCWFFVSYTVSDTITDRTVWAAAIDGQPIHLVP
ncbi:MAG: pilus assembly protein TadG-related protein [Acidimicrobiia bacterium]|nr:pilus assembly protein TadG-related protein [Acidimicrobiia bacterium]